MLRCSFAAAFVLAAAASSEANGVCSESWYRSVEARVPTGDGQSHGPDVGSDEWKSVVEFKLGIRGQPGLPSRDSEAWCRKIDEILEEGASSGPSFPCEKVRADSTEALICGDPALSALDRSMADVFAAASAKAVNEHPPVLKAELKARYRLISGTGPVFFQCDGQAANEVVATFFATDPPTLIAERGDAVSLMYLQPSASGSRYEGRNETFWEHGGEASVTWGYGAPEMHCKKAP